MHLGRKTLFMVLLFTGLVLINYLASSVPFRLDATAERIYTLSPGTLSLLSKLEEPLALEFYYSRGAKGLPVSYKNYAARVQEMLQQYVRASKGKLSLKVIDPQADTPDEERATAAGLQPQLLQSGEQFYFGLVAIQADQQKNIASFNPQRESFLEYDLSQLIYTVQQVDKKKLGLITSLPLKAPMDFMAMQRGKAPQDQFILGEWERSFEIVRIDATATELPAGLDVLAVIHPQGLSPKLQFAVDQFLLGGKPVLIAVDPSSQYFKQQSGQMGMMGAQQPNVSSDLPVLLGAYGVSYAPTGIVGDNLSATKVQTASGDITPYPVWLNLTRNNLNSKALATAQLSSLMFIECGFIAPKPDSGLNFQPLVETSDQAGEVQAMALQFAQPDDLARQIKPSGKKVLAAMLTGSFKTAFPAGAPKEEAKKDKASAEKKDPTPEVKKEELPALKESKTPGTLIVVADTDWLLDDYSVRRFKFLGAQAAEPLNDNLYFGSNILEFLGGSQDLVSIRGKGSSLRPFTVVKNMEAEAQKRYRAQLESVETKLKDVQQRLSQLQGKKGEARSLVASPDVQKAVEEYQKQESQARRERREIRRALREEIDALENYLLVINLSLAPLFVCAFGFWFNRRRT